MLPLAVGAALLLQAQAPAPVPFAVGEQFEFAGKVGILKLGTMRLEVVGRDSVRGREAWHFRYSVDVGSIFYKAKDTLESWVDVERFAALRFRQHFQNSDQKRDYTFEIFPDRGYFTESGRDTTFRTPATAIDDAGFFYLVRTLPLEVGQTYTLGRYFRLERNPLTVQVLGTETLELPDDTKVECLVVHPEIPSRGMFAPKAEARVWLTNDARRIPVQIKSKMGFGTATLKLRRMVLPAP